MTVKVFGREMVDPMGGVFADSLQLKPARVRAAMAGQAQFTYTYGPEREGGRAEIYTCPVSVIPDFVWSLFDLWWQCRMLNALPKAGGVLDQPLLVRRSFPEFEVEHRALEERQGRQGAAVTMATVLGTMFGKR